MNTEVVQFNRAPPFIFFWRAGSEHGFMSQWYDSPFVVMGVTYKTAEHYMMAMKALTFNDHEAYEKILNADHPRKVKALGRTVKNFDYAKWGAVRFQVVVGGNSHKFEQHPGLMLKLAETKGYSLVEASPFDKVWGIGLSQDDARAQDSSQWEGMNLLGDALNVVRGIYLALQ